MLRSFISLITVLPLFATASLLAQDCTSRSLKTIDKAIVTAASDTKAAEPLLRQAEETCPTSAIVKRKLANVYRDILLDPAKADALDERAGELDGNRMTTEQPKAESSVVRDKWALCIGVSKFQHLPAENQLKCPAKDAQDFASALLDPNIGRFRNDDMHVHVLTDDKATLQGLMSGIDYISAHARADDLVVLYISSHGLSASSDRYASGDAQTGYIVTYDTNPQALFSTAFAMEDLKKVLDHLRAKRIVVFLDTCFSGDSFRALKSGSKGLSVVPDSSYERIAQGTGRVMIVSSTGSQFSWEGSTNSYFTECLVNAMKQRNGLATVTQIFNTLDHDLPYKVQMAKNATQTPMMWPQNQNVNIVIGTPIE